MSLMYSCRKVAELLLQAQDEPLGLLQQWQLRLHLTRCGNCRNFGEQLREMHELLADDALPSIGIGMQER